MPAALPGSTMMAVAWPSLKGRSASGCSSSMRTVRSSGAAIWRMAVKVRRSLLVLPSLAARVKAHCTVCAVSGAPLEKRALSRRWNVHCFRSGELC